MTSRFDLVIRAFEAAEWADSAGYHHTAEAFLSIALKCWREIQECRGLSSDRSMLLRRYGLDP